MYKRYYIISSFIFICFLSNNASAQFADCIETDLTGTLQCLGGEVVQEVVNENDGRADLNADNQGCLSSGEDHPSWYKVVISEDGTLAFTITPISTDDYDFAIYGPDADCSNLDTPIRCSYAAPSFPGEPTGLSFTATDETEGAGGDGFVSALPVLEGEVYYILINNFSPSTMGFTFQAEPDENGNVPVAVSSSEFSQNIYCNTIALTNTSGTCEGELTYLWEVRDEDDNVIHTSIERDPTFIMDNTGTYTVTLTTTVDSDGINDGVTVTSDSEEFVIVNTAPEVDISGLDEKYCAGTTDAPSLSFLPDNSGTLRLDGSIINIADFDISTLDVGNHRLLYRYVDPDVSSCVGTDTLDFEIVSVPEVNITNIDDEFCPGVTDEIVPTAEITLHDGTTLSLDALPLKIEKEEGGTFTLIDDNASYFSPDELSQANGTGTYRISYSYTNTDNPEDCSTKEGEKLIELKPAPIVSFNNLKDIYCVAGGDFTIQVNLEQADGSSTIENIGSFILEQNVASVWTVLDNNASSFNPNALGLGLYRVTYTHTDATTSCSATIGQEVEVVTSPDVQITNLESDYCINDESFTLEGTPNGAGGIFTIDGTTFTEFNPADWLGSHEVKYEYTDPDDASCFGEVTQTVVVNEIPDISFDESLNDSYCFTNSTLNIETNENPAGGMGQITINGVNTNQIDLSIPGTYNITYEYTENVHSCTNQINKTIVVNRLPVVNSLSTSNGKIEFCGIESNLSVLADIEGLGTITAQSFDIKQGSTIILDDVTTFSPKDLPFGNYTISYVYTDPSTNCSSLEKTLDFILIENNIEKETFEEELCPDLLGFELFADPIGQDESLSYLWLNSEGESITNNFVLNLNETSEGQYIAQVFDGDACPIKEFIYNIKIDCNTVFELPNAFSPNADGLNDILEPLGKDFVKLDWKIFDRWGEIVFIGDDLNQQWDGLLRGKPAPEGTYLWVATYENILEPDRVYQKKGKVTIIR